MWLAGEDAERAGRFAIEISGPTLWAGPLTAGAVQSSLGRARIVEPSRVQRLSVGPATEENILDGGVRRAALWRGAKDASCLEQDGKAAVSLTSPELEIPLLPAQLTPGLFH